MPFRTPLGGMPASKQACRLHPAGNGKSVIDDNGAPNTVGVGIALDDRRRAGHRSGR
jgi:hypothetical protein